MFIRFPIYRHFQSRWDLGQRRWPRLFMEWGPINGPYMKAFSRSCKDLAELGRSQVEQNQAVQGMLREMTQQLSRERTPPPGQGVRADFVAEGSTYHNRPRGRTLLREVGVMIPMCHLRRERVPACYEHCRSSGLGRQHVRNPQTEEQVMPQVVRPNPQENPLNVVNTPLMPPSPANIISQPPVIPQVVQPGPYPSAPAVPYPPVLFRHTNRLRLIGRIFMKYVGKN